MKAQNLFLVIVAIMALFLAGCATTGKISLGEAESDGALTGSIANTLCQQASDEHREKGQWPNAARLARLVGLSAQNYFYDQNYAVWILNKPYHQIPAQMDSTQTFAFYGYYCAEDNSYYTYCRIYYQHGPGKLEVSISDSQKKAGLYGLSLSMEEKLLSFFSEAKSLIDLPDEYGKVVGRHTNQISKVSPNPTARQLLYEFTLSTLIEFFNQTKHLNPDDPVFQAKLEEYSLQLAIYINSLDWKHLG